MSLLNPLPNSYEKLRPRHNDDPPHSRMDLISNGVRVLSQVLNLESNNLATSHNQNNVNNKYSHLASLAVKPPLQANEIFTTPYTNFIKNTKIQQNITPTMPLPETEANLNKVASRAKPTNILSEQVNFDSKLFDNMVKDNILETPVLVQAVLPTTDEQVKEKDLMLAESRRKIGELYSIDVNLTEENNRYDLAA